MFTTDTKFSDKDPYGFLSEVWHIDPLAAIRIANKWVNENRRNSKSSVALRLLRLQNLAPLCSICERAVLPDEQLHGKCEEARRPKKVEVEIAES